MEVRKHPNCISHRRQSISSSCIKAFEGLSVSSDGVPLHSTAMHSMQAEGCTAVSVACRSCEEASRNRSLSVYLSVCLAGCNLGEPAIAICADSIHGVQHMEICPISVRPHHSLSNSLSLIVCQCLSVCHQSHYFASNLPPNTSSPV